MYIFTCVNVCQSNIFSFYPLALNIRKVPSFQKILQPLPNDAIFLTHPFYHLAFSLPHSPWLNFHGRPIFWSLHIKMFTTLCSGILGTSLGVFFHKNTNAFFFCVSRLRVLSFSSPIAYWTLSHSLRTFSLTHLCSILLQWDAFGLPQRDSLLSL